MTYFIQRQERENEIREERIELESERKDNEVREGSWIERETKGM
jgi:hypothetical protein